MVRMWAYLIHPKEPRFNSFEEGKAAIEMGEGY